MKSVSVGILHGRFFKWPCCAWWALHITLKNKTVFSWKRETPTSFWILSVGHNCTGSKLLFCKKKMCRDDFVWHLYIDFTFPLPVKHLVHLHIIIYLNLVFSVFPVGFHIPFLMFGTFFKIDSGGIVVHFSFNLFYLFYLVLFGRVASRKSFHQFESVFIFISANKNYF